MAIFNGTLFGDSLIGTDLDDSLLGGAGNDTLEGAVSSGTFTNGHVGPEAVPEVLRVVRPGGWVVLSVNARHYAGHGFEAELRRLAPSLGACVLSDVPIYGAKAIGPHAKDRAVLLSLRKA